MLLLLMDTALQLARLRRAMRDAERGLPQMDDHLRRDIGLPPRVVARPLPPRADWA
jgi:hypothetical protein